MNELSGVDLEFKNLYLSIVLFTEHPLAFPGR